MEICNAIEIVPFYDLIIEKDGIQPFIIVNFVRISCSMIKLW